MSCCILLVLDLKGKSEFDPERLRTCLRPLPGIRNWDENNPRHQFFCEFIFDGDRTIVHMLKNDRHFVYVEGMGSASLQVALEIQRRYGEEVHAVDDGCSFYIPLSKVSSLEDFNEKIISYWGRESLERK